MQSEAQKKRRKRCAALLKHSPSAEKAAARRGQIEAMLKATQRRIWPLAKVARMLGISNTLLRRWIGQGCLRKRKVSRRGQAPGIPTTALREFLKSLSDFAEVGITPSEAPVPVKTDYCLMLADSPRRRGWKPTELAAKAGVSVSLVRHLIRIGRLTTYRPSRSRIVVTGTRELFWK